MFVAGVRARGAPVVEGIFSYIQEYRRKGSIGRWWPRGVALTNLPKKVLAHALDGVGEALGKEDWIVGEVDQVNAQISEYLNFLENHAGAADPHVLGTLKKYCANVGAWRSAISEFYGLTWAEGKKSAKIVEKSKVPFMLTVK